MKVLLFLLAIAAAVVGVLILQNAKSAIHEIEAWILFLIAAVFLVGAAIVESLASLRNELRKERRKAIIENLPK